MGVGLKFSWIGCLGGALLVSTAVAGYAQTSMSMAGPQRLQNDSRPVVRSEPTVTVMLANVTIGDALSIVAQRAGLHVMYSSSKTALNTRKSVRLDHTPISKALKEVLSGTGYIAVISDDRTVLIRDAKADEHADQEGTVVGRVIDSASGKAISGAAVAIRGTKLSVLTNGRGEFTLRNVPVGAHVLTVRRFGYKAVSRDITVQEQGNTTVRIELTVVATVLSKVVTTGAGEREKLEVGNSIATINADSIMQVTPVATVSDLLENRVPGLQSISGTGAVGAPTRMRIRGISSIESNNSPIVIVDGVRISTASATDVNNTIYAGVTGGIGSPKQAANDLSSRIDDIDPNSIASIEVMKGPAASTLYGSDAANGVIIIKTKHGHVGSPRWNLYYDHDALVQPTNYDYPIEAVGYPLRGGAALHIPCSLADLHAGRCVPIPGETIGFNMLEDPRFTPQARGHNQSIGGNVSGGVSAVQYYLGGTYLDQLGTAKLPNVNANWIVNARDGQKLSEDILRPNARTNATANGRLSGGLGGNSDFSLGATFISQYQRVGSDGLSSLLGGGADVPRAPTDTSPLQGFDGWYATRSQKIKHTTANAQINWRPQWGGGQLFSMNGTYGWDLAHTNDTYFAPRGSCEPLCSGPTDKGVLGYIDTGRESDFTQTLNIGSVLSVPLLPWLYSQTRFGGNYVGNETDNLYGYNTDLLPGVGIYGAGGNPRIEELGDFRGTLGWYLEQNVTLHQTLYLTVGLRKDAGSALGKTVTPVYPKWNGSWVLSQEPFFPKGWSNAVSMLRLRFAYGRAGVMPSSTARIRSYELQTGYTTDDGASNGYYAEIGDPGNLEVRPERSAEVEGGFDLELFASRLTFGFTMYDKSTKDAIQSNSIAPSLGVNGTLMLNVGDVDNRGTELEGTLRILDRDAISYSIDANVATSTNKLVRLAPGSTIPVGCSSAGCSGNASLIAPGYPLFGRWAYPLLGWKDVDGNGFIDPAEVRVNDSLAYVGPSTPTRTMYIGHTLGFFRNRLTVRANFAYSGGMTQFNQARKNSASYLAVINGPDALSLKDQACLVVANREYTNERATDWCYMETIKVWRLQDMSISFVVPPSFSRMMRAQSMMLTFSGTNLHVWSNYHGIDPNINTMPVTGNETVAGAAFPTPRTYGFRVQLTY
jgi:TonB-dependent SusC/RagA subfamily outer membrane receptor